MSIDNVVIALECAMEGKEIEEGLLAEEGVSDALAAFFFEKEARPELVALIDFPDLMKDYLGLSVETRDSFRLLRNGKPGYLEGDLSCRGYKMSNIRVILDGSPETDAAYGIYIEIGMRKQIAQIVESFIKHQPKDVRHYVSLLSWFVSYDIFLGTKTHHQNQGKKVRSGNPQGYFIYERISKKNGKRIDFDEAVQSRLKPDLLERLLATQYYSGEKVSIESVVRKFIEFQPSSNQGPISLYTWFSSYDIYTGTKAFTVTKRKKVSSGRYPQGRKISVKWKLNDAESDFDQWVLRQLSPSLRRSLLGTRYFQTADMTIEDITRNYIKHQPKNKLRFVSPKSWFLTYDAISGEQVVFNEDCNRIRKSNPQGGKFYKQWQTEFSKMNPDFDDWLCSVISPELSDELKKTSYFTSTYLDLDQILELYIKHKPKSSKGFVSPKSWLYSYDAMSGECLIKCNEGKVVRCSTSSGSNYYQRWARVKGNYSKIEDWIKTQVDEDLWNRLMQTPYYTSHKIDEVRILESYLRFVPQMENPPSLTQWTCDYDIDSGTKIVKDIQDDRKCRRPAYSVYRKWLAQDKNQGEKFEDHVLRCVSQDLRDNYLALKPKT